MAHEIFHILPLHAALLVSITGLAIHVVIEDIKNLEISLNAVLILTGLMILDALIFSPSAAPSDAPSDALADALAGMVLGASLGMATRLYTQWRTASPGFGGADIAILIGGGAMLGPMLVGPWVVFAVLAALLSGLVLPRHLGRRDTDIDGVDLKALPLCPALLLTLAATYGYANFIPPG